MGNSSVCRKTWKVVTNDGQVLILRHCLQLETCIFLLLWWYWLLSQQKAITRDCKFLYPILCSVTLKCHYWITNFFSCCNIILCWLPAWAEIWNCHPQTCKSDSTSLTRKVKLNIHSQAAFQVQTVWSSLRQNIFKLKHIFSSFLCSKNSEWVSWVDKS